MYGTYVSSMLVIIIILTIFLIAITLTFIMVTKLKLNKPIEDDLESQLSQTSQLDSRSDESSFHFIPIKSKIITFDFGPGYMNPEMMSTIKNHQTIYYV